MMCVYLPIYSSSEPGPYPITIDRLSHSSLVNLRKDLHFITIPLFWRSSETAPRTLHRFPLAPLETGGGVRSFAPLPQYPESSQVWRAPHPADYTFIDMRAVRMAVIFDDQIAGYAIMFLHFFIGWPFLALAVRLDLAFVCGKFFHGVTSSFANTSYSITQLYRPCVFPMGRTISCMNCNTAPTSCAVKFSFLAISAEVIRCGFVFRI